MIILSLAITKVVSSNAREDAQQHLSAITDERAQIIMDHVSNAEALADAFSKATQVSDLLNDKNNKVALQDAQKYTDSFAEGIEGIEGLYIADWDEAVSLTHINKSMIGKPVREGERLSELHQNLFEAGKNVYTAGVILSPLSGDPVISMYKTIYNSSNQPIGFIGMALETGSLIEKLENMKTPGLEGSFYSMVDVKQRVYVFDEEMQKSCQEVELPDLIQQCDIYQDRTETESTTYEFTQPFRGKCVGASYFIPQYHWLLMMNDTAKEVYSLAYTMRIFLGAFSVLILAMMVLFTFLNKKQETVNRKLLTSVEAVNETKKSLNVAMFGDVLTGVGNRIKLATDLTGITDGKTNPYYFAMFNIMEFSNINTAYGSDTGDSLLVRTADTLKSAFPNGEVYRTGSDEFVVMIKSNNGTPTPSDIIARTEEALKQLSVPESVAGVGKLYPKYKIAAIKKATDIDASVITILKEMTNVKGEAVNGMIDFNDMTE
jgi:GGDEF domain-containing protein